MTKPKSIGFPRMQKEAGELRVFLPDFIQSIAQKEIKTFIEYGYGSRSGYTFDDYCESYTNIHYCSREEAFHQDLVLILRSPKIEEFELLHPGGCLISMLHYSTRPKRIEKLLECKVNSISLDSIANDRNIRLVENMRAVAWNGLETAFGELEKRWSGLCRPDGLPIKVLILGTGMVGKHAVDAVTKLGNIERNIEHMQNGGNGALGIGVGRNITGNADLMKKLLEDTDILVDAVQRRDSSKPIIPNEWIAWLPEHAVITDLAVDPYTMDITPTVVRGIEGIPQGNLDHYVFTPDDPKWDQNIPAEISSEHRRTVVSCYSWPGIHPEACMRHYGQQLLPLLEALIKKSYDGLSAKGKYFDRALYRASLHGWLKLHTQ
jgi:alanine dehydrogenase